MAVSALRALSVAHLQSSWNRLRKQLGRSIWAMVAVLVILAMTSVLPILLGAVAAGYAMGTQIVGGEVRVGAVALFAFMVTVLTIIAGLLGGLSSGSRQLPWETLRGFPVRSVTLFFAELVAGAGEIITILELGLLTALTVGAMIALPRGFPFLLVLWATHVVAMLSLQQLAGSVAQRLARRLRWVLLLLPVLGVSMSWLGPKLATRMDRGEFDGWQDRFDHGTRWMPARAVADAVSAIEGGRLTFGVALWAIVFPLVVTAVLVVCAWWLVAREKPLENEGGVGKKKTRLWSFRSQAVGIARLQVQSLAGSITGRFGLVMPLLTLVLIRGPLAQVLPGRGWTAPIAFGYASLASTNLLFNQFGLDRHGVKVLFLLPIEARELLRGKWLGFAVWQGLQAALLLGLLVLTGQRDPIELATGVGLFVCIFLIFAMVGQLTSIWSPRPLKKNGTRASQPPLSVVLIMLGTMVTAGGVLYGVVFGVRAFWPGWELAVIAAIGALLFAMSFPVLAFNVLFLERNREKLVETLGASG